MKLINRTLGFLDGGELDEAEALGAMGLAVADDLHVLDGSDTAEELLEVALGGVEGEVADIDAGRGHLDALGLAALAGGCTLRTFGTGSALLLGSGLLATETDEGEELGEETRLLRGLLLATRAVFTAVAALWAAGRGTGGSTAAAVATAGTVAIGGII
jgi:hypothetical protein